MLYIAVVSFQLGPLAIKEEEISLYKTNIIFIEITQRIFL